MAQSDQAVVARYSRGDFGALGMLIATAVFCTVIIWRLPPDVGFYIDDGVYLATGKALSNGQGYRHIELPGAPYQTKYPILYPLVLAVVWRVMPAFPGNITLVQLINIACWTGGSWFAYRLATRVWRMPWWLAACGVSFAFANIAVLSVMATAMSEGLYLLLSMGALAVALVPASSQNAGGSGPVSLVRAGCVGLLAGATYLTRSIGVTLLLAIVVVWLMRREWRAAATAAVIGVLAIGGWQAWCGHAAGANAAIPTAAEFRYDLDYGAWVPHGVSSVAWVAYQNSAELMYDLFQNLVSTPPGWSTRMVKGGPGQGVWLYLGMLVTAALAVVGFVAAGRRGGVGVHVYICSYAVLSLTWPFEPARFLIPLLPLVATLVLAGTQAVVWTVSKGAIRLVRGVRRQAAPREPGGSSGLLSAGNIALGATMLLALVLGYWSVRDCVQRCEQPQVWERVRARDELMKLVRERTPSGAVIADDSAAYLFLCTGRRAIPFVPLGDPVELFYPADRRLLDCGRVRTRQQMNEYRRLLDTRLAGYWRAAGATHFVEGPAGRGLFAEFRQNHPLNLSLVGTVWPYVLYQLTGGPG